MAIGTHSAAHLDSRATISLDDSTVAEMTKLADVLEALDADKFPATVRIAPAVLNGLQQLSSPVFNRLIAALQDDRVVAEPQWPLDPAAAALAGQELLYTSWRRDGQERFAELGLGGAVVSTSTILVDQPIGVEGAALRWRDGARLMVVSPEDLRRARRIHQGLQRLPGGADRRPTAQRCHARGRQGRRHDLAAVWPIPCRRRSRPGSTPWQACWHFAKASRSPGRAYGDTPW